MKLENLGSDDREEGGDGAGVWERGDVEQLRECGHGITIIDENGLSDVVDEEVLGEILRDARVLKGLGLKVEAADGSLDLDGLPGGVWKEGLC
ncbi:MAG: hypothetical protein V1679_02865 [Candidatus Peregrinibacteria bacterium]